MANVIREKGKIIVTLENGKQTYMNINDLTIHGVSGKVVSRFSPEAVSALCESDDIVCRLVGKKAYKIAKVAEKVVNIFTTYSDAHIIAFVDYLIDYNITLDKAFLKMWREHIERDFLNVGYPSGERISNLIQCYHENLLYAKYNGVFCSALVEAMKRYNYSRDCEIDFTKYADGINWAVEHEYLYDYVNYMYGNTWGLSVWNRTVEMIAKYITNCQTLKVKPDWKNFLHNSAVVNREVALMRENANMGKVKDYQLNARLEYENDEYIIVVPTEVKQFKDEAMAQNNCVFAFYFPRVKNEETHIVFVRKKNNPGKPFITCEVTNSGYIRQYLGFNNEIVCEASAEDFRREYQEYLDNR